ncbi:MAG: Gfo/Idh/MocA family oxidoreductase, partial [Opitutales bacterium]|nr:Gfo/Idh/MocA family oxidoreductase [Opitutales bacterium]
MFDRRQFLKNSALLGSAAMFTGGAARAADKICKNGKLRVAAVGVGGRGRAIIDAFRNAPEVKLVAFCDVDDSRAAQTYKEFPAVPRFRDYRVMLDKMDKAIDAVAIATPDHMHYPIAAWAMSKGKHVYCEKPLARTVWETREMRRLANKYGVITQMGNQGHTNEGWRLIKEWYDAGIIGDIEDIYIWTNRPIWPQGDLAVPPAQKVPSSLDYKLWLGVAPYQPYNKAMLPFNWRGLRNFGTGAAGDMACHFLDVPYSAFDLGYP